MPKGHYLFLTFHRRYKIPRVRDVRSVRDRIRKLCSSYFIRIGRGCFEGGSVFLKSVSFRILVVGRV